MMMIQFLLFFSLVFADLSDGEKAYRNGQYQDALSIFQSALSAPDAAQGLLLYNMGNCSYRLGKYAEAVLNYRRAQLRLPRDPELKFNLHLAEQQLGLTPVQDESFGAAVLGAVNSLTPSELFLLTFLFETLGLFGFILLRRRRAARNVMLLFLLLGFAGAIKLAKDQWFPESPSGIVLSNVIELRSEPRLDLPVTLKLKAGESLSVSARSDRWVKVTHVEGSGWTESAGIGIVD